MIQRRYKLSSPRRNSKALSCLTARGGGLPSAN
jgi:hypothetical protein